MKGGQNPARSHVGPEERESSVDLVETALSMEARAGEATQGKASERAQSPQGARAGPMIGTSSEAEKLESVPRV